MPVFCSPNCWSHIFGHVISHLLFAFHPQCMSSSDLFFSENLLPVPRKTDAFSVSFIHNFPLPNASCISILCIKVGQRSKCSKDFKLAGRNIEGPISLSYRNLCSGSWALENQGFPLHCMFSRIRSVWIIMVFGYDSFIHLQLRIISSLCIALPVLTSRVRNKARCVSPQGSFLWVWGTVWGLTWGPKSKQQQLTSIRCVCARVKSLPAESLSPAAVVWSFLEPRTLYCLFTHFLSVKGCLAFYPSLSHSGSLCICCSFNKNSKLNGFVQ